MVGTHRLLWDPFLSHVMLRLRYHFCDPNPTDHAATLASIAELCSTMDDDSVLIIFPEGGNWTPRRWERSVQRLHERGHPDLAARAKAMTHVLAPRPAGAIAALRARDDLTVVFVAHVGLEDLYSLKEIWRHVPLRREVRAAYWSVPHDSIPTGGRDEVGRWLFDQWEEVDRWISDHAAEAFTSKKRSV